MGKETPATEGAMVPWAGCVGAEDEARAVAEATGWENG